MSRERPRKGERLILLELILRELPKKGDIVMLLELVSREWRRKRACIRDENVMKMINTKLEERKVRVHTHTDTLKYTLSYNQYRLGKWKD